MCQRLYDTLLHDVIKAPRTGKRTSRTYCNNDNFGVFGRARAAFTVKEGNERGVIHWHALVWAGLPAWVCQRAAEHKKLLDGVRNAIDIVVSASLPDHEEEMQARRLLSLARGVPQPRTAHWRRS